MIRRTLTDVKFEILQVNAVTTVTPIPVLMAAPAFRFLRHQASSAGAKGQDSLVPVVVDVGYFDLFCLHVGHFYTNNLL